MTIQFTQTTPTSGSIGGSNDRRPIISLKGQAPTVSDTVNSARCEISAIIDTDREGVATKVEKDVTSGQEIDAAGKNDIDAKAKLNDVEEAYEQCKAVRSVFSDNIEDTKWSKQAIDVFGPSLRVLQICMLHPETVDHFRQLVKKEGDRLRAPNKNNRALLALQISTLPGNKAQQKELSRFSRVLWLAHHHKVEVENAITWLEGRTLRAALKEERSLRNKPRKPGKHVIVPIERALFPTIAKFLESTDAAVVKNAQEAINNALVAAEKAVCNLGVGEPTSVPAPAMEGVS